MAFTTGHHLDSDLQELARNVSHWVQLQNGREFLFGSELIQPPGAMTAVVLAGIGIGIGWLLG